ncbi:MAG: alpha-ketoacid dehydrogenase subunit beta [Oscillospiraceae bacterium]|nr:alpha-ketoacid dehydrogenase subunit beta [Oscillospiraceae bacterium]MBQ9837369.1 alpha-ketoacid dehydrogenase subunit beta [Oscillospiraceae bacterium]
MRKMTYRDAIIEALDMELARNPKAYIAGEDVASKMGGAFGATKGLVDKYGKDVVIDTPISETALMGMGVGSAVLGYHPFIEIMYMDFIGVCMDEIMNQAGKFRYMFGGQMSVPLMIRMVGGSTVYGAAHHSQCLESMLCHIPGIKVVWPSTPADAKGLIAAAARDNNPVIVVEHKGLYNMVGDCPEGEYIVPIGKAEVVREGADVTVVTWGLMRHKCMEAAEKLAAEGIDCEVIDLRSLKPIDTETLFASVAKTNKLVIVHEANKTCGLGAEIAALVAESCIDELDAPVVRVAGPDTSVPFSPPLEEEFRVAPENIIAGVKTLF